MTINAIIFDFDGLILDTESSEWQAWHEVYLEFGCDLKLETWVACIGRPSSFFDPCQHLEDLIGRSIDRTAVQSRRRERCRILNLQQPIRPGVTDWIRDAQRLGIKLAVVSSSSHAWVDGHLERLGLLEHFNTTICREDTPTHKPDPAPYLKCLDVLGIPASQAIAIEDSPPGIAAAKAANLFCLAVPNALTDSLDLSKADLRTASLADLPLSRLLDRSSPAC